MKVKITSLNLAGYLEWERRLPGIISYINYEQPDILLLQEVKFDPAESDFCQSALLNEQFAQPYAYEQTSVTRYHEPQGDNAYREGLAVLSMHPILKSEALVLIKNNADEHTRIVQNIDIEIDDKAVPLTNLHFSNNKYSDDQFRELLDILDGRNEKRILCGDFNIFNLEDYADLYSNDYTASTEIKKYISFPDEKLTLDYMLLPKNYRYVSLALAQGLSDHAALTFTIEI